MAEKQSLPSFSITREAEIHSLADLFVGPLPTEPVSSWLRTQRTPWPPSESFDTTAALSPAGVRLAVSALQRPRCQLWLRPSRRSCGGPA